MPPPAAVKPPKLALAVLLVAAFMDLLDISIVSVALPAIQADLEASAAALQWTVAAYTLAFAAGLITGGRLGDLVGRRRVFLLGVGAFVVFSAGCALAQSSGALIAMRALQGLAAAVMVPQVLAIITSSFPVGQRGAALGAYGATLGMAAVAGPVLGGGDRRRRPLGDRVAGRLPHQPPDRPARPRARRTRAAGVTRELSATAGPCRDGARRRHADNAALSAGARARAGLAGLVAGAHALLGPCGSAVHRLGAACRATW